MSANVTHIKWPSIERLHNLVRGFDCRFESVQIPPPSVLYRPKVKLDGTNAGVQVRNGKVYAQSRNQIITTGQMGFAQWALSFSEYFLECAKDFREAIGQQPETTITFFGEWCGSGIQKRTAISKIGFKIFALFGIQVGEGESAWLAYHPEIIHLAFATLESKGLDVEHQQIHILPWATDPIQIDFANKENLKAVAETINSLVESTEDCDLWVKETFGQEGVCEGYVYYPLKESLNGTSYAGLPRDDVSDLMFKAKGARHEVKKVKAPVEIDTEKVASVQEFVEKFVTENRLDQGLQAIGGELHIKNTGKFLKWFNQDVCKESVDELLVSELNWKDVSAAVSHAAVTWWKATVKAI